MSVRRPDQEYWKGRRVLLTGHTGFKGSWLALWLNQLGADVYAFALPPSDGPSLFDLADVASHCDSHFVDLRDASSVADAVREARPEIVLHLAAQALVRRSLEDPIETFDTNVTGLVNLLEALRGEADLRTVLVVTSDKVYWNNGCGSAFKESAPLGGKDPYSASKAAAEHVAHTYAQSYFERDGVRVATSRGGNVIGGGDFAADRIAPDCVRAALDGETLTLRHPEATRPWQHALDCLCGYLLFAETLSQDPSCPRTLNIGPRSSEDLPVRLFAETLLNALGHVTANGCPKVRVEPVPGSIEAPYLQIDASLARSTLGWDDDLVGRVAIASVASWFRQWLDGADMGTVTMAEINAYQAAAS